MQAPAELGSAVKVSDRIVPDIQPLSTQCIVYSIVCAQCLVEKSAAALFVLSSALACIDASGSQANAWFSGRCLKKPESGPDMYLPLYKGDQQSKRFQSVASCCISFWPLWSGSHFVGKHEWPDMFWHSVHRQLLWLALANQ